MHALSSFIKQNRMLSFVILTYLFSWWPLMLYLAAGFPVEVAAFGPFLAALVVLSLSEGKSGVMTLLGRMVRWRVGVHWNAASGEFFSPMFTGVYAAQQAWMRTLVWGIVAAAILIYDWRWWTKMEPGTIQTSDPVRKSVVGV